MDKSKYDIFSDEKGSSCTLKNGNLHDRYLGKVSQTQVQRIDWSRHLFQRYPIPAFYVKQNFHFI